MDITPLIVMGIDDVVAMREESIDNEQKAFDNVISAAKQWEHHAAVTQAIDQALKYLRMPEVPHTYNQWEKSESYRFSEEISNRVYMMYCSIWENTRDDRVTKQSVPVAWYVSWNVIVNSPLQGYREKIAGQNNKRFTDKDAALKYLEGRKKAYAHLFTSLSPKLPERYKNHFSMYGKLLPGYSMENEDDKHGSMVNCH